MKGRKITVNLLALPVAVLAIWLGATGRVDWWTIGLIALSHAAISVSFTL